MTQSAYNPVKRTPVATEADQARMREKLQNKLKSKDAGLAERSGAGLSNQPAGFDSPAPLQLEWAAMRAKGGYYSKCKRYSICDVTISGVTYWECWKLAGGSAWFRQLAVGLRSDAEARAAAQRDSDKRT